MSGGNGSGLLGCSVGDGLLVFPSAVRSDGGVLFKRGDGDGRGDGGGLFRRGDGDGLCSGVRGDGGGLFRRGDGDGRGDGGGLFGGGVGDGLCSGGAGAGLRVVLLLLDEPITVSPNPLS